MLSTAVTIRSSALLAKTALISLSFRRSASIKVLRTWSAVVSTSSHHRNHQPVHIRKHCSRMVGTVDLSGIINAIPTPFAADGSVAHDKLESNIRKWNDIPFRGYLVLGSVGENVNVSIEEHVEITKTARKAVPKSKLLVVGAGCLGTQNTIDMCKRVAAAGADVCLVVTPFYYKPQMTGEALTAHYTSVADKSPIPIVIYNSPGFSGIDMPISAIVQCAKHPNIVGIKESSGDILKIGKVIRQTKEVDPGFQVSASTSTMLVHTVPLGAVGAFCILASMLGQPVCDLYQLCKSGQYDKAIELHSRLLSTRDSMTGPYYTPNVKATLEWFGYYGGLSRLPLMTPPSETLAQMKESFVKNGFLTAK